MCSSEPSAPTQSSMTESSRTRSDSLEESSIQQDRKRPRLDPGRKEAFHSQGIVNESDNMPTTQGLDHSDQAELNGSACHSNLPTTTSDTMEQSSSRSLSKVTINTRSTMSNESVAMDDSVVEPRQMRPQSSSPSPSEKTEEVADVDTHRDMLEAAPEIISIHSSPSRSPEIQIAVVEDIDQDPAETSWTPVTRLSNGLLHEQATPQYVTHTFPYTEQAAPGCTHEILAQIGKMFLQGSGREGPIFMEFKKWLVKFLQVHPYLTHRLLQEEKIFWEEFPDAVNCLLRRMIDMEGAPEASSRDLEDFFVAYGQLSAQFLELDIHFLEQCQADQEPMKQVEICSRPYLPTLASMLRYRDVPFYSLLQASRGLNIPDLVGSICDRLSVGPRAILPTLTTFIGQMNFVLPAQPPYTVTLVQSLVIASAFARSARERREALADQQLPPAPAIQAIYQQLFDFLMKADEILQAAISKQVPWLTIENSPDILRICSRLFEELACDPQTASRLVGYVLDQIPDNIGNELPEVISFAWKFKTLRKYIFSGRMELRVYGMEAMRNDLIDVWRVYTQFNPDSLDIPLVKYLVDFLRETQIVKYVVGVDSHPQLINRSSSVIGFLVVTHTYLDEDSDVIWQTVLDSQDPRTVSEVLHMLKLLFQMCQPPEMIYLCRKLLRLPVERYDTKMVGYVDGILASIEKSYLTPGQDSQDRQLAIVPCEVFVKIIRDVVASGTTTPEAKDSLSQWAAEKLTQVLALPIAEKDKRSLWEQCINDIAQKTAFAPGSMRALQAWVEVRPQVEVARLTSDFNFTPLLIDELISYPSRKRAASASQPVVQIVENTQFSLLLLIAEYAPETITDELIDRLWSGVLASPDVDIELKNVIWDVFSRVAHCSTSPNPVIDRLMIHYLPRLTAESLNDRLLHFAENSVLYEIRTGTHQREAGDQDVVSLPGINRVWRFVMECPSGTIENEASSWIIKQYLDHDFILRWPRSVIEATHRGVLDRCLTEVFAAASRLRTIDGGAPIGQEAAMVVEDTKLEDLRFTRSLLFLRQFLSGVKSRPRYSPPLNAEPRLATKPFQQQGEEVTINYQVVPHPGSSISSIQKKLAIGNLNTMDDLGRYLSDLTGLTEFTGISLGQKIRLIGNEATIKDSSVNMGNLLIQKVPDSLEKLPAVRKRPSSSLESHIMDHFDQFYDLLDLQEHLSKEVYTFLELFPPQSRMTNLVMAQQDSVAQLLPVQKPYKLLHGLSALRLRIEEEALGSSPDEGFLTFAVRSMISVLNRFEAAEADVRLRILVTQSLLDSLLMALRAQVSADTSKAYFFGDKTSVRRLVSITLDAANPFDIQESRWSPHRLVTQPFSALMECSLHDSQFRSELFSNDSLVRILQRVLFEESRGEVRKAVGDILLSFTGQSLAKTNFPKPSDPRSPQSRFPAEFIREFLIALWSPLAAMLAKACHYPSSSQQLFEAAVAVMRVVGKHMPQSELCDCFKLWTKLLIAYDHRETVGRSQEDYIVWGFTNLLYEILPLIHEASLLSVDTGKIAQSIFDAFLYPDPEVEVVGVSSSRIPLLRATTREDLFSLVNSLIRRQQDYDGLVQKFDGLVEEDNLPAFLPHMQCERQALRSEVGYAGLRNLSNTCYSNSLFSQLFMNVRFREFIFSVDPANTGESNQYLLSELSKLFSSMQNRWDKYVDTSDAISCIETYDNDQIDVSIQMDVDEFFNLLFDRIEGQITNPEDKNLFRSLYGGQLVQQIKSRECDHISERLEPFSAIQCEIKGKMSLEDSLRAYVEGEIMQGDNKYSCTSCGRHVDAVKRACLKDVPDHLIFNLKRFDFDITTMTRCKVNDEFRFPDSIDMAPYTVESLSNPNKPQSPDMFELVGVLVHSGTAESGHYYSYIRERPSSRFACDSWVQFNDIEVSTFDAQRIGDCCFGGIEIASSLHLPKSHNAYMLFYQRVASIKSFETKYKNRDAANPVRIPFDASLMAEIDERNQETIRSYCLQDPSHARFVRMMLERMRWGNDRQCSPSHVTEDRMLRHALEYTHQVSCRFKEMPEFYTTCGILGDYSRTCFRCAQHVAAFFAEPTVGQNDGRRGANLRFAILKNPNTTVRRSFAGLLLDALRAMKTATSDPSGPEGQSLIRAGPYRHLFTVSMERLMEPWHEIHKYGRAWNDYFDLVARLASFGVWEAGIGLRVEFLEKAAEVIWADARHDPMDMRGRYSNYVGMKEKGRLFGLSGLVSLMATLLDHVEFTVPPRDNQARYPRIEGLHEISLYEYHLLRPMKFTQTKRTAFEWLRRIIMCRQNPNACEKVVKTLVRDHTLMVPLQNTLIQGLSTESVADAILFLDPTIEFCRYCTNSSQVQSMVRDSLSGIDSIGNTCGKEHLDFVTTLVELDNQAAGLRPADFFHMVFRAIKVWAPTLLIFPDDIHHDVRGETMAFLQSRLFSVLGEEDGSRGEQEELLRKYARTLARACVSFLQLNYLPRQGKQTSRVEPGQAYQITRVIDGLVRHLFGDGDAANDQFAAEAQATLERLAAYTLETAEVASEDWLENDSGAASESENGENVEWNQNS